MSCDTPVYACVLDASKALIWWITLFSFRSYLTVIHLPSLFAFSCTGILHSPVKSSGMARILIHFLSPIEGSLQSLDWNGGMERWNGMVELLILQKGGQGLLMHLPLSIPLKLAIRQYRLRNVLTHHNGVYCQTELNFLRQLHYLELSLHGC